jgi:hypothetical protein
MKGKKNRNEGKNISSLCTQNGTDFFSLNENFPFQLKTLPPHLINKLKKYQLKSIK